MRPISHDWIVLVEQIGWIAAGDTEEKFQIEIVAGHGDRPNVVLRLTGIEAVDDFLHDRPITPTPKVPKHDLLAIGGGLFNRAT